MYVDAEMVLIFAIALFSGLAFYAIAARDPQKDNAGETPSPLCDSPQ